MSRSQKTELMENKIADEYINTLIAVFHDVILCIFTLSGSSKNYWSLYKDISTFKNPYNKPLMHNINY